MKHVVSLEPIGIKIEVNHNTPVRDIISEYGIEFSCGGKGVCGKCKIKLLKGNIDADQHHRTLLEKHHLSDEWRLACLSKITEDVTIYINQCEHIIQTDETPFKYSPEEGYGLAVDLGSTTIVSQLVNLKYGKIEAAVTSLNPQTVYGSDIISRISYALSSDMHYSDLTKAVRNKIKQHIFEINAKKSCDIRKVVICGNSVMHHLFSKLDITPLSAYPFQSSHNEMQEFNSSELDWPLAKDCRITFLPNISHFVGSDILSGIEAIQMHKKTKYQVLLDLGTNGEIVIGNRDHILCTSTAAGPAFEGINISQGMKASTGAIYQIGSNGKDVKVVGNGEALGICGSGLIDAIYSFLVQNKIDISGAVTGLKHFIPIYGSIGLTDKDIREFQLAKAAIATGYSILMKEMGITDKDIEHIYISGGLGNYLDIDKANKIGLLETEDINKIVKLNNSALLGTKMFLFDSTNPEINDILKLSKHCSLESHPQFQDIFCDKLFFPVQIN